MAQAVGELGEVALEVGEVEQRAEAGAKGPDPDRISPWKAGFDSIKCQQVEALGLRAPEPMSNRPSSGTNDPAAKVPNGAHVDLYTSRFNPDCMRVKGLLDHKGITYSEYLIDRSPENRNTMIRRAQGRNSVPQIFINGRGIGGSDELQALDAIGELDRLLAQLPPRP
jgi:glutaredoxin 3